MSQRSPMSRIRLQHKAVAAEVKSCLSRVGLNVRSRQDEEMFQIRSITTSAARSASAFRSSGSDVSTVPPGSANATTSASTADPRRASRRSCAARLASVSGTATAISQVLRKRFSFASRPGCPWRHSTRTTAGTVGGHRPSSRRATINASALRERSANRLTAPESSINTNSGSKRIQDQHRG